MWNTTTSADFCVFSYILLCSLSPMSNSMFHDGETLPQTSLSKINSFHLIYLLYLHLQPSDSMGLSFDMQTCPIVPASYTVSVRQTKTLLAASFRFHLAMDTLAVRLMIPTIKAHWELSSLSYLPCQAHIISTLRVLKNLYFYYYSST